ncbi:periplasmic heavy metal sensor [Sphingomonas sp. HDW15A]|uniref:periplasmic heavy metal sensor n=1 Tax=Sphingomonas sp. HDW15A TaxID=2714942 RepID=UPI00140E4F2A|nr:periplasmic heavy metal sensor [Sphingomonas sp. HDW15A]QIK95496.1 periplasmic heavy metal sensor [Sphingomonas sp. HDW15A]
MSLFLLLLALQGAEPVSDPPPLKVKPSPQRPAQPAVVKAPGGANPTITYVPAKPKPDDAPTRAVVIQTPTPASDDSPLASVSEAARARLAQERQADAARRSELRREMIAAQDAIAKVLAAEPLDLGALKAALERRDQVMAQSRSKVTLAVMDLLGDIPADERLTVAKALIESEGASSRPAPEPKPKPAPVGR